MIYGLTVIYLFIYYFICQENTSPKGWWSPANVVVVFFYSSLSLRASFLYGRLSSHERWCRTPLMLDTWYILWYLMPPTPSLVPLLLFWFSWIFWTKVCSSLVLHSWTMHSVVCTDPCSTLFYLEINFIWSTIFFWTLDWVAWLFSWYQVQKKHCL